MYRGEVKRTIEVAWKRTLFVIGALLFTFLPLFPIMFSSRFKENEFLLAFPTTLFSLFWVFACGRMYRAELRSQRSEISPIVALGRQTLRFFAWSLSDAGCTVPRWYFSFHELRAISDYVFLLRRLEESKRNVWIAKVARRAEKERYRTDGTPRTDLGLG